MQFNLPSKHSSAFLALMATDVTPSTKQDEELRKKNRYSYIHYRYLDNVPLDKMYSASFLLTSYNNV